MDVKVEKLKESKVKLTITLEPKELVRYFEEAFNHIAEGVKIQGFRAGKAPRAMVESTVGVSRILSEALDMAVNENYLRALHENKLSPISSPNIAISKYPSYGLTAEEISTPLEYVMEIQVFPEVKVGDFSKLKIETPTKETAKEADIEKIIDNLKKQKANFIEIDREARKDDFAEISFEGFLKKVRIDQMCSKNHPLVIGEGSLIPGFEDQLVGMKKGDKKEFKIKFPKDYHGKEYAGKEAEFNVELLNLKEVKLPEVDEAFAKDFGQESVEELMSAIEKNLQSELDQKYKDEIENRVLDKILPLVVAEIPATMIDREVERMVEGYRAQLQGMGMNFETYLGSIKKTIDDLKKDMRPAAERNVKIGLLLGKTIEDMKLDPQDKESGKKAVEYLVNELTK